MDRDRSSALGKSRRPQAAFIASGLPARHVRRAIWINKLPGLLFGRRGYFRGLLPVPLHMLHVSVVWPLQRPHRITPRPPQLLHCCVTLPVPLQAWQALPWTLPVPWQVEQLTLTLPVPQQTPHFSLPVPRHRPHSTLPVPPHLEHARCSSAETSLFTPTTPATPAARIHTAIMLFRIAISVAPFRTRTVVRPYLIIRLPLAWRQRRKGAGTGE